MGIGAKIILLIVVVLMLNYGEGSAQCNYMKTKNSIPAGYHPTSVRWEFGNSQGDLVCIQKTEGKSFAFVEWQDFERPEGYYIDYEYPNPSTTFNGCRSWTTWNGETKCTKTYKRYHMKKSE